MVKLLSDFTPHKIALPEVHSKAQEDEIPSISAKGRSSDKHTNYIFFMPMCMLVTV